MSNLLSVEDIRRCRVNYKEFVRTVFKGFYGKDFIFKKHHNIICDELAKCVAGKTTNLIINIPPRYGKTELAIKLFIPWCLGNFKDSQFINTAYAHNLALENNQAARNIMGSEIYAQIYPEVKLKHDDKSKTS